MKIPICPHALENDIIGLQCLEMDSGWQSRMHTLRQSLGNDDPSRNNGIFEMTQQHLVELSQCGDQIRPFGGVFKRFQSLVHLGHVTETEIIK